MSLSCVNGCKVCDGCMKCQEEKEIDLNEEYYDPYDEWVDNNQ